MSLDGYKIRSVSFIQTVSSFLLSCNIVKYNNFEKLSGKPLDMRSIARPLFYSGYLHSKKYTFWLNNTLVLTHKKLLSEWYTLFCCVPRKWLGLFFFFFFRLLKQVRVFWKLLDLSQPTGSLGVKTNYVVFFSIVESKDSIDYMSKHCICHHSIHLSNCGGLFFRWFDIDRRKKQKTRGEKRGCHATKVPN